MPNYGKNFLTNVVVRIDFNPVTAVSADTKPSLGGDALLDFPNCHQKEGKEVEIMVSDSGHSMNSRLNRVWEFRTNDQNTVVSMSPAFLSIEWLNFAYSNFEEAIKLISNVWLEFIKKYHVEQVGRIGLRYINQVSSIEGDTFDLDGWLNDDFAAAVKTGFKDGFKPVRSMHQVRLKNDDITVLMNYGMFNSEYPNPIAKKEFVIDIDSFVSGDVNSNQVESTLRDLNKKAEDIFESSIGSKLRDYMGESDEQ